MRDRVMFLDPGDVHVGIAIYQQLESGEWQAVTCHETTPQEAEDIVAAWVDQPNLKVIGWERFKLYGHLASQQIGSEFWTSQLIGACKYIVRTKGHPELDLVVQDASIQTVAQKVAAHKKLPLYSVVNKKGPHAKSAELHALYWLWQSDQKITSWRTNDNA
jgi:hypothetical protein